MITEPDLDQYEALLSNGYGSSDFSSGSIRALIACVRITRAAIIAARIFETSNRRSETIEAANELVRVVKENTHG